MNTHTLGVRSAEELAGLMAGYAASPREQVAQTRFRMALVDVWQIEPGMKVLEIGCGQGDMTAALAEAVGPAGHVMALDSADPGYGAPVTLGESAEHLLQGELGSRMTFRFGVDVLDPQTRFGVDEFDVVVLALCTWYFASMSELHQVLDRVRAWAPRLHLAEWDLHPATNSQLAHLLAVLIQGQIEARSSVGNGNVRTPYSREHLYQVLSQAGWTPETERLILTNDLADARWEVANCLDSTMADAKAAGFSEKEQLLLASQLDILRRLEVGECLPAYSITAIRGHDH